jgi:hypothetical protein
MSSSKTAGKRRPRTTSPSAEPRPAGKPILRVAVLAALAGGAFLTAYALTNLGTREKEGDAPGEPHRAEDRKTAADRREAPREKTPPGMR